MHQKHPSEHEGIGTRHLNENVLLLLHFHIQ